MTNNSIFQTLLQFFRSIYQLGDDIKIFNDGTVVSLNQFVIALALLSIILGALLNFVKAQNALNVDNASDTMRGIKRIGNILKHQDPPRDGLGWRYQITDGKK